MRRCTTPKIGATNGVFATFTESRNADLCGSSPSDQEFFAFRSGRERLAFGARDHQGRDEREESIFCLGVGKHDREDGLPVEKVHQEGEPKLEALARELLEAGKLGEQLA